MNEPGYRFSLRSLLAVVTICCVLLALIFPAIQAAREAARRTQCGNNLKQIGQGHVHFHDSSKHFPPGMTGNDTNEYGWGVHVLPFMMADPTYGELRTAGVIFEPGGTNRGTGIGPASYKERHVDANIASRYGYVLAKQEMYFYLCPSSSLAGTDNDGYGASHYCGNAGNAFADYGCGAFPGKLQNGCLLFANDNQWTEVVTFDDIADGLENTILVGEVDVSQDVSATKTDHGCFPIWAGGNNDGGCSAWNMGSCLRLCDREFPINAYRGQESNLSFGSGHRGGAQFAMGDASIRWIANNVDLEVWRSLGSRNDGDAEVDEE